MTLSAGYFGEVDFTNWARGVAAAFIQGGAAAVTSGFVVSAKDPQHYGFLTLNFFEVVGSVFIISGLLGMFSFLAKQPLPAQRTVTTTTTTVSQPLATVTTRQESHQEPVAKPPVAAIVAAFSANPTATKTCEASLEPVLQALPVETDIP